MDATTPTLIATIFHRPSSTLSTPPTSEILTSIVPLLSAQITPTSSKPIPHALSTLRSSPSIHRLTLTPASPMPLSLLSTLNNLPALLSHSTSHALHIVIHPALPTPKLALFDMDSTLIGQEIIDLLASLAGPAALAAVSDITSRAMNGELDFSGSLRARVALLRGLESPAVFERLWREQVTYTPGAVELLRALKGLGVKTALLSGGFMPLAGWVAGFLGIDHAHANALVVDERGRLMGEVDTANPVVDAGRKEEFLWRYVEEYGVADARESVLAVGDGANDLKMLWAAGLGVAVNAKPRVQLLAPCRLNGGSLVEVLYLMGLDEKEVDRLTKA